MSNGHGADVEYFLGLFTSTRDSLDSLCGSWEAKLEQITDISEELRGKILSTIGQGRLLGNPKGRLTQFKTLVDNCQFNLGEKKTTLTDLQGFWDMINYQVENVYKRFEDLKSLEADGWKTPEDKGDVQMEENNNVKKGLPKKGLPKKKKISTIRPAGGSGILRQLMAAKRKEMKSEPIPAINLLKTPSPVKQHRESKTFQGGFFNVTSPVRPATVEQRSQSFPNSPATGQRFEVDKSDAFLRRAVLADSARRISNSKSPFAMMKVNSVVKNLTIQTDFKQALFTDEEKEN